MDSAKEKALKVRDLYHQLQDKEGKPRWGFRERTEGLVGDVGDLMKLIAAKDGLRNFDEDLDKEIAHELSDVLWCVLVIADELEIDIEEVFSKNMDELAHRVEDKLKE